MSLTRRSVVQHPLYQTPLTRRQKEGLTIAEHDRPVRAKQLAHFARAPDEVVPAQRGVAQDPSVEDVD